MTTDLFGERRIHIDGNPKLEGIANHILELIKRAPELQGKEGEEMGFIDSQLAINIWMEEGLRDFIPEDKRQLFAKWFCNPKTCTDFATINRARRYLESKGLFRPPASAVVKAEQHRERIARSVKG